MARFLHESHGYRREDMVILTDDQKNPMSIPTKANILRAMQWLVSDAQPNDALFIHFSGRLETCSVVGDTGSLALTCRGPQVTAGGRQTWMATRRMVRLTAFRRPAQIRTLTLGVGYDDVIYPLDYRAVGHIVDDEMHDILLVVARQFSHCKREMLTDCACQSPPTTSRCAIDCGL